MRRYRFVAEAHSVHHAWPEILDDDIAHADEFEEQPDTGRVAHIDADVALAGVLLDEVTGKAVDPWTRESGEIAERGFDLDHVGAHVAQHPRCVRAAEHTGQIEHPNSVERPGRPIGPEW